MAQADESLFASEHYENGLQVPTFGLVVSVTVNAHTALSVPPPLHAVLVVYDEHAALAIQLVPFETHALAVYPEQAAFVVPPVISSQTFNLHDLVVTVVVPVGKAKIHGPSNPIKHPASTYDEQLFKGIH